jgi:hypothetical protein
VVLGGGRFRFVPAGCQERTLSLCAGFRKVAHQAAVKPIEPLLFWGLGFGFWVLGLGVRGLGSGVWGLGFEVWGLGSGAWGLGFGI